MKSRSQLILCDTCSIIELFRIHSWEQIIDRFDVIVSSAVKNETMFYLDEKGNKVSIDLQKYINTDKVQEISVTASQIKTFFTSNNIIYQEKLDAGELELLCYLFLNKKAENILICSGDAIVFKLIGKELLLDKGISLEEMLEQIGHQKKNIQIQFTRKWKKQKLQEGFQDSSL